MNTKQKVAEILAARDNLPVDDILDQLDEMIKEMRDDAEYAEFDGFELDLEGIWTEWTGLEPDYFAEFIVENL